MLNLKGFLIAGLIGIAIGGAVTLGITKAVKPVIKLECPQLACNCPEQKPCNGIDFDKIKSKSITIENTQYLTVNGDSVLVGVYIKAMQAELAKLKLARCK
jgi:hypothetical protein